MRSLVVRRSERHYSRQFGDGPDLLRVDVPVGEEGRRVRPQREVGLYGVLRLLQGVVAGVQEQVDVVVGYLGQVGLRVHPAKRAGDDGRETASEGSRTMFSGSLQLDPTGSGLRATGKKARFLRVIE